LVMESKWKETILGEIIKTNISSYSNKDSWEYVNYLDTGNITENNIDNIQKLIVGFDKIPSRAKRKVENGDIIYSTVRPNQLHYGIIKNKIDNLLVSTGFTTIRTINTLADNNFIFWYLTQAKITKHLQSIGENSTTTYPSIKPSDIEKLQINLPPLSEQKAIARILSSLDDKIELNRQMNQTLEQMAQAMFKSWFVDFDPVFDNALSAEQAGIANNKAIPEELQAKAEKRKSITNLPDGKAGKKTLPKDIQELFPDEFELTEEMGWIPKGWVNKPLSDLITLIGGGTPKTSIKEYWDGNIPWFSVVDAPNDSDVFVLETEKKITQLGIDKSSTKLLRSGTTIITARGTVGKCAFVGKPMTMNQSCYGIVGNNNISDTFIYYAIRESVANLQQKGHGSVFNTITRDTFKTILIPFSNEDITQKFDDIVSEYFDKIKENLIAINNLTQLRDTLLPKLISGELRVPEELIEKE